MKKYDLSSFTGENITAMKLGKDENMLFLGSKDMNVYLIDISKGKLCVVYEGHWSKIMFDYIFVRPSDCHLYDSIEGYLDNAIRVKYQSVGLGV